MKRIIDFYLKEWKNNPKHKPLLIRGARQVGKSHSIIEFGKNNFSNTVIVNFEKLPEAKEIFKKDKVVKRIIKELSSLYDQEIIPGSTLLFIDEIQAAPEAIITLRYFYEDMQELHVIAAGSLIEFAIEQVGIPVGRVPSLYMYPMSFLEFLVASGSKILAKEIFNNKSGEPLSDVLHKKALNLLGEYLAIGGMPEAVNEWISSGNVRASQIVHSTLIDTYRQDFGKYANQYQIKYLEKIFNNIPEQLGSKFKYSKVGEYRKRELEPCLDALEKAQVINKVYHTSGQGIPIGAHVNFDDFKTIFIDVGLTQYILGINLKNWLTNPEEEFINKGQLAEAFIGQEILAYADPINKLQLYYWHRDVRGSEAEIDNLMQIKSKIIPIEIKSGSGRTLKSLNIFLSSHPNTPYGVRFWINNFAYAGNIYSYPLYAAATFLIEDELQIRSIESLLE